MNEKATKLTDGKSPVPEIKRPENELATLLLTDPEMVFRISHSMANAIRAAPSNTRKAWESDWKVFHAFVTDGTLRTYIQSRWPKGIPFKFPIERLPVDHLIIEAFVDFYSPLSEVQREEAKNDGTKHVKASHSRKPATIERYLATIAKLHRIAGILDPCTIEAVKDKKREMFRHQRQQKQAVALSFDQIEVIVNYLPSDQLWALRTKAMLVVATDSLVRRQELVDFDIENISYDPDDGPAVFHLRKSKTDQEGRGVACYVGPGAMRHVMDWLQVTELKTGPLFCQIQSNGEARLRAGTGRGLKRRWHDYGRRLNADQVARSFKEAVLYCLTNAPNGTPLKAGEKNAFQQSGIDSPDVKVINGKNDKLLLPGISGHSTRIGAAIDLEKAGLSLAEIMSAGRWRSTEMPSRYTHGQSVKTGPMAKFHALRAAQRKKDKR